MTGNRFETTNNTKRILRERRALRGYERACTVVRRVALVLLWAGLGTAPPAAAQPAEGLLLGPVTFAPTISVRDAGIDSNVFNEPGEGHEDQTFVFGGGAEAKLRVGSVQFEATGAADYLYFRTYAQERGLNGFGTLRVQPQFSRIRPFVGGAYRRTRDRANSEIDVRAPRTEREASAGVEAQLTRRARLDGWVRRGYWEFDEGETFRGIDLALRLNRRLDAAHAGFRYELSPLTTFTVETGIVADRFTESPDHDTDMWRTDVGFLFSPDAVIRGRALVGFSDLRARGAAAVPFRGPTAEVELSYTLLERTVFSGRLRRETTVSSDAQPYYLSTLAGVDVSHTVAGPVDLIARIGRERLDYDAVPAFSLPAHLDRVETFGGGLVVRLGLHARVSANYEERRRRSDALQDRNYDRHRLYTTISYGF